MKDDELQSTPLTIQFHQPLFHHTMHSARTSRLHCARPPILHNVFIEDQRDPTSGCWFEAVCDYFHRLEDDIRDNETLASPYCIRQ